MNDLESIAKKRYSDRGLCPWQCKGYSCLLTFFNRSQLSLPPKYDVNKALRACSRPGRNVCQDPNLFPLPSTSPRTNLNNEKIHSPHSYLLRRFPSLAQANIWSTATC